MKRKILAVLLVLCMAVSLVPTMAFSGFAASDNKLKIDDNGKNKINTGGITITTTIGNEITDVAMLKNAFALGGEYKLTSDITLTEDLSISVKEVTLDLNGYVLSGEHKILLYGANANGVSRLTLTDSRPDATHADSSLPKGGVVAVCIEFTRKSEDGTYSINAELHANGGTITAAPLTNTNASLIKTTGSVPTEFRVASVNYSLGKIYGGIYYGNVTFGEGATVGKKITFMDGDSIYAVGYTENNTKAYAPATEPTKAGYTFAGWYNGNTKFDFNTKVTSDITLTAKWKRVVKNTAEIIETFNCDNSIAVLYTDITLEQNIEVYGKNVALDLNGWVLSGKQISVFGGAAKSSTLLLIDDRPVAKHRDATLTRGGILKSNIVLTQREGDSGEGIATLAGYKGTVEGSVTLNTEKALVIHNNNSSTTSFTHGIGGKSGTVGGGLYYGNVEYAQNTSSGSLITLGGKKVTFKDGENDYAIEIVKDGTKTIAPKEPTKAGYIFDGWYNGNSQYNFSGNVTDDLTLTAKWIAFTEVRTSDELQAAFNQKGTTAIKLMADITFNTTKEENETIPQVYITARKITLDINGYVLSTGNKSRITLSSGAELTLIDSRPDAKHADASLPDGGIINIEIYRTHTSSNSNYAILYANGGTVTKLHGGTKYAATVYCTSDTPTAFTQESFDTRYICDLLGGIYYGNLSSTSTAFKGLKMIFKVDGAEYAVEALKSGDVPAAPIAPTKEGYSFAGWYVGNTKQEFLSPLWADLTVEAKWVEDNDAPVGTIKIGDTSFTELESDITAPAFVNSTKASITATDTRDSDPLIEYLISDKELSADELSKAKFTRYLSEFTVKEGDIVYARITDAADNVKIICTRKLVLDTVKPVITGAESGKNYCTSQTLTVDEANIESVTVNGRAVTLTDGKLTVDMSAGKNVTVVVTDKAGNKTELTLTYGHTFGAWIDEVAATVEENGTKGHKDCTACGKHFDGDGNELTELSIEKLPAPTDDTPDGDADTSTDTDTDTDTDKETKADSKAEGSEEKESGCKSTVAGIGAVAITVFAAAFATKKKKSDENE